jgi:hypothetical protein
MPALSEFMGVIRVNSRQDGSAGLACNPCLPCGSQAGVDHFNTIRGTFWCVPWENIRISMTAHICKNQPRFHLSPATRYIRSIKTIAKDSQVFIPRITKDIHHLNLSFIAPNFFLLSAITSDTFIL